MHNIYYNKDFHINGNYFLNLLYLMSVFQPVLTTVDDIVRLVTFPISQAER